MADKDVTPPIPAPSGKGRKAPAPEPTFSDAGAPDPTGKGDTMDVNPTPRHELEAKGAVPAREYVPDPFGGRPGPAHLVGPDLARSGGGADQRIDDRQGKLADKYRNDPAIKKLMADEARKVFGVLPDEPPPADAKDTAEPDQGAAADDKKPTPDKPRSDDDVAEIARLSREKRELKDKLKAADGARTEAKRIEMLKEIAKEYPIAAVEALLGVNVDAIYADDVAGKSKNAGDKIKNLDPAAKVTEADAVAAERTKREEAEARAAQLEAQMAETRASKAATAIAREDGKRWELCLRDPAIGETVVSEVKRLYAESDAKAGGHGKGWRPKDDAEAVEFTRSVLDDLEKHYEGLGKRFARGGSEPVNGKKKPPTPPAGQRQPQMRDRPQEHDRYARPPKRESVEDRQDRLIAKYAGTSFTED